ncbi:hypothetical protein D3C86_2232890 [compost metagenome]
MADQPQADIDTRLLGELHAVGAFVPFLQEFIGPLLESLVDLTVGIEYRIPVSCS